jgi:hypothetical protein
MHDNRLVGSEKIIDGRRMIHTCEMSLSTVRRPGTRKTATDPGV